MPILSDKKIRAAKASEKPFKLFDQNGLFLLVQPNGSKGWRLRWKQAGKEKLLALGVYPEVSLATARDRRDEIRKQIANGIDPSEHRRAQREAASNAESSTFKSIAMAWHSDMSKAMADPQTREWTDDHAQLTLNRLNTYILPKLGDKQIGEIGAGDLRDVVTPIKNEGKIETARRVMQLTKAIMAWAIEHEKIQATPVLHMQPRKLLGKRIRKHRAAILDPIKFGALLRGIDTYPATFTVRQALRFVVLTFVRSAELRTAEWHEFDLNSKNPIWRIPGRKMKMKRDHLVPLSTQAVAILREMQQLAIYDGTGYVFPGVRNASRPLSGNTLNSALRTLGFAKDEQTAHGFRRSADTMLSELGLHRDAIERQLAHAEEDDSARPYNAAEYLPIRREIMQAWADYLDGLRSSAKVIPIHRAAK